MKKLLIALSMLVSVSVGHAAQAEVLSGPGLTEKEMEFWSNGNPKHLKMMMMLRKDPRLNTHFKPTKEETRPNTAPLRTRATKQELASEALHQGIRTSDSEKLRNEIEKKKAASGSGTPTLTARRAFRETTSEGGTPRFIRKSITTSGLSQKERSAFKKELKRINALRIAMDHAQLLNSNDASSEQIVKNSTVTLSPAQEANKVLKTMKQRIKTKRQALLELNDAAINKHNKELTQDFPHWETDFESLVDYVTAFFKPAIRDNKEAAKTLKETKDIPIRVELTEKNWQPPSTPRGGTPTSSVHGSRPETPTSFSNTDVF